LDHQDHLVLQEREDCLVNLDLEVSLVYKDHLDQVVNVDRQDNQVK
jgi:hypothetical protein